MARMENIFVNSGAPSNGNSVRPNITDLRYGGQFGYSSNFRTWINSAVYVTRPVIPILLEPPRGFLGLPDTERNYWISALKHLVEEMPRQITGLKQQLTVSTEETPFGGAGQVIEVFTDVKEERPSINFTWDERTGMGIQRFLSAWIRFFMMDQNTKFATANTMEGVELTDLLADQYSMTMMFIEPDENHRYVNQAWVVANMFPKSTGTNEVKRDLTSAQEKREVSVEFTGFAQYGAGVDYSAQQILDTIKLTGADPNKRQAFVSQISDWVTDKHYGYLNSVQELRAQQAAL